MANPQRNADLRRMIWTQGTIIGTQKDNSRVQWFAVDGKVYRSDPDGTVIELGDYFLFLEQVRTNEVPDFQPANSLTVRVHNSMKQHFDLASKYERGGNDEGARYLRYVGNLLAALLRGQQPKPILPDDE